MIPKCLFIMLSFPLQDPTLQDKLRAIGGIPILYIAYKTVLLDPVSEVRGGEGTYRARHNR